MAPFGVFKDQPISTAQPDQKWVGLADRLPGAIWALMAFEGLKLWLENKTK